MMRFGQSNLTVQYFCSWEHIDLIGQSKRIFEVFHHLLERQMSLHPHPVPKCLTYCLGTCSNENEGRLLLVCHRYRESGMIFWCWSFMKCFNVPSTFLDEGLDGLYQSVAEHVLPFRLFHKQSLQLEVQVLYQARMNLHVGKASNDSIAYDLTLKIEPLCAQHFPFFIWTFDEQFDKVSLNWRQSILNQGTYPERSSWIRPHWHRLQMIFEETWQDFKELSARSFEFVIHQRKRTYEFVQFSIDNFLPCNGIGQTFQFSPWTQNWKFSVCSIAFYCKQRTHCQWGAHPFLSCMDSKLDEEEMKWMGTDCLTIRFVFQTPHHTRPCDTFIYEADYTEPLEHIKDRDCTSSLLWVFGHAIEQCLMRQIENEVFDRLGAHAYQHSSPFSYMEQLNRIYDALKCEHVQRYPMRLPLFQVEQDLF